MSLEIFIALISFMFVTSMTPGPNNIMLMASGVNFGFKRSLPHMIGITLGFQLLLICVAVGLGSLLKSAPILFLALKFAGGGYLVYLAYRIAISGPVENAKADAKPLGVLAAAAFQWVNPKAWVATVAAIATFTNVENYFDTVLIVTAVAFAASMLSTTTWTLFGTALRGILSNPKILRPFNIVMALLLVASLWPMLR